MHVYRTLILSPTLTPAVFNFHREKSVENTSGKNAKKDRGIRNEREPETNKNRVTKIKIIKYELVTPGLILNLFWTCTTSILKTAPTTIKFRTKLHPLRSSFATLMLIDGDTCCADCAINFHRGNSETRHEFGNRSGNYTAESSTQSCSGQP